MLCSVRWMYSSNMQQSMLLLQYAGYGRQSWLHETFRALEEIWAVFFLNIYSLPVIIRTVELRG